jgi:phenylalanyl-tRNA synthetase beta chain
MKRILAGLGFRPEKQDAWTYEVPSWRVDVDQEEDLVEEIARHHGYDKIASELPPSNMSGEYQPAEVKLRKLRRALNACGYDEAINFSFIAETSEFELIPEFAGREEGPSVLQNPIIEDASRMRQTLLPGLISSLRHNMNHGIRDVRLFEIGRIFAVIEAGELPQERLALGMLCTGGRLEAEHAQAERDLDFFDLKGALETGIEWMNLPAVGFASQQVKHLRPGQSAAILLRDGHSIGSLGRLSDAVSSAHKFRQPVYVLELDLSSLLATEERVVQYTPLPRYPSVVRDVSLLLDRNVTLNDIVSAVNAQAVSDCRAVRFVGTYEGTNIPEGKRSITVRIEYRSDERTLRDEEVEQRHTQLTSSLLETFHAEQR